MSPQRMDVRLANEAWEAVLTAHNRLTAAFAADGTFKEVSMREYDVLYTLAKRDAPLRLGEVQSGVLLSQPALSRLVDRLAARGLVARSHDDTDGRAVRLSLTALGRDVQRRVGRAHARCVARELHAALTGDDQRELRRIASALAAGPAPAEPPTDH
ncbi:MarR family transcriptional regulator [Micrococcales bacterium 31B]|nr:MarR family transcriptional regulator [Micrococcales bacterium 31B]